MLVTFWMNWCSLTRLSKRGCIILSLRFLLFFFVLFFVSPNKCHVYYFVSALQPLFGQIHVLRLSHFQSFSAGFKPWWKMGDGRKDGGLEIASPATTILGSQVASICNRRIRVPKPIMPVIVYCKQKRHLFSSKWWFVKTKGDTPIRTIKNWSLHKEIRICIPFPFLINT